MKTAFEIPETAQKRKGWKRLETAHERKLKKAQKSLGIACEMLWKKLNKIFWKPGNRCFLAFEIMIFGTENDVLKDIPELSKDEEISSEFTVFDDIRFSRAHPEWEGFPIGDVETAFAIAFEFEMIFSD